MRPRIQLTAQEAWTTADGREGWRAQRPFADYTRFDDDDHITDALICLHWLRMPERIVFKVAVQTYRALHDDDPQ